jgi:hypothetical protein
MQKKNTISKNAFEKLTDKQKINELKKMAKRGNVRISLLEEKHIQNGAYYEVQDFNLGSGRLKNRFYEGIKYENENQINETFNALSSFLSNDESTLGGIENSIKLKVRNTIEKGNSIQELMQTMTGQEKIYAIKESSKIANKQLKTLEKEGLLKFAYANADYYNNEMGRKNNRFYQGGIFKNEDTLANHVDAVDHFLRSKTATPEGYKQISIDRINAFREKGINIPKGKEQEFYDFLSSEKFKALGRYGDSNQIIETYVDARNASIDAENINKEFDNFLNENISLDIVQERLGIAKWQKGGLLH